MITTQLHGSEQGGPTLRYRVGQSLVQGWIGSVLGSPNETSFRLPLEVLEHNLDVKLLDYADTENVLVIFSDVVCGCLVLVLCPARNTFLLAV